MSGGAPIVRKERKILENDSNFSSPLPLSIGSLRQSRNSIGFFLFNQNQVPSDIMTFDART